MIELYLAACLVLVAGYGLYKAPFLLVCVAAIMVLFMAVFG